MISRGNTHIPASSLLLTSSYNRDVFAPFWCDNDIRKAGTVRYLAISRGKNEKYNKMMDEIIIYLKNDKTIDCPADYQGEWGLVVQWDKVHPSPHGAHNHLGISEDFLSLVRS